jgi:hypothetical protein
VTPHFAHKPSSIIDQRTTRHQGYAISQRKCKWVEEMEEIFGWLKIRGRALQDPPSWRRTMIGC